MIGMGATGCLRLRPPPGQDERRRRGWDRQRGPARARHRVPAGQALRAGQRDRGGQGAGVRRLARRAGRGQGRVGHDQPLRAAGQGLRRAQPQAADPDRRRDADAFARAVRRGVHPRARSGKVGDWRGGGRTRGVAVGRRLSPAAGASARAVAPSPVAARQTGRAACPHPAFTCVLKPSRSAGRHGGVAGGRGRAPRTGARPGIGGTRCLAGRSVASTIVGPVARRTGAPGRRSGAPALG